jgi:hypothetical protein
MKHCILKAARSLIRKSSFPAYVVIPYRLFSRHHVVIMLVLQKLENKVLPNKNPFYEASSRFTL